MSTYAEQILAETTTDSFAPEERRRLLDRLDANPPLREDVLTLLAQFKVNLGPHFLHALLGHLDGEGDGDRRDPLRVALEQTLAVPVAELGEKLRGRGTVERRAS